MLGLLSALAVAVDAPVVVAGEPHADFEPIAGYDVVRLPVLVEPVRYAVRYDVQAAWNAHFRDADSVRTGTVPVYLTLPAPDACTLAFVRARAMDLHGEWGPWTVTPLEVGPTGSCEVPRPITPKVKANAPVPDEEEALVGPVVASLGGASTALGAFLFFVAPAIARRRGIRPVQ